MPAPKILQLHLQLEFTEKRGVKEKIVGKLLTKQKKWDGKENSSNEFPKQVAANAWLYLL